MIDFANLPSNPFWVVFYGISEVVLVAAVLFFVSLLHGLWKRNVRQIVGGTAGFLMASYVSFDMDNLYNGVTGWSFGFVMVMLLGVAFDGVLAFWNQRTLKAAGYLGAWLTLLGCALAVAGQTFENELAYVDYQIATLENTIFWVASIVVAIVAIVVLARLARLALRPLIDKAIRAQRELSAEQRIAQLNRPNKVITGESSRKDEPDFVD